MITTNYENRSIAFGAKFDKRTHDVIMNSAKIPTIKKCVSEKINQIEKWGDKESVISLVIDQQSKLYKFVIKNPKFNSVKSMCISDIFNEKNILTGFLNIYKNNVEIAERYLKRK